MHVHGEEASADVVYKDTINQGSLLHVNNKSQRLSKRG